MSLGIVLFFSIHVAGAQECPSPSEGPYSCIEDCHDDSDCFTGLKCCQKDCGLFGHVYECTNPVTAAQQQTKSHVCPTIPDYRKGDCTEDCRKGCTKPGEMCCSNGCGQSCMKGVTPFPLCSHLKESIMALGPITGEFVPQCEEDGSFVSHQCEPATGYCWCVDTVTGIPVSEQVRFKVPQCGTQSALIIIKLIIGSAIPAGILLCFCIPIALHFKRMLLKYLKKKRERQILNYSVNPTSELYIGGNINSRNTNEQHHASPSIHQDGPSVAVSVEPQAPIDSMLREAAPPSYADRLRYKNAMGSGDNAEESVEPPPSYDTVVLNGRHVTMGTGRRENTESAGREPNVEIAVRENTNPET